MIGWPFSKSEDDGSDEENRHWASSEEDCFRNAKEVWMGTQKSRASRRRFRFWSRLRFQREAN